MDEAISSHIGGWFRNAATSARIHPIAQPQYEYDLPDSAESPFTFTATVAVEPKVEFSDWTTLEVPRPDAEVPAELVDAEIDALRDPSPSCPRSRTPAREGDVVVVDVVSPSARRAATWSSSSARGAWSTSWRTPSPGWPGRDEGCRARAGEGPTAQLTFTVREITAKILPPPDDDLARAASEFDTLAELRNDIEERCGIRPDRRDRVRLPGRCRGRARPGVGVHLARWSTPARTSCSRLPAHAREPRHLPRDLPHGLQPDPEQLHDRLRAEAALGGPASSCSTL